ncbi:MAG: helix-turn-helix transcriptional regulator, partial [Solobacterium sp.]|nr:helix-turn-helix transcriptional regulator [Solobacterium sp.]
MTFGEKLKEARKTAGLSQEQLAEKLSVSRSAVAKWEADLGMPDIANLKAMAQLLDISIDYLLMTMKRFRSERLKSPSTWIPLKKAESAETAKTQPAMRG